MTSSLCAAGTATSMNEWHVCFKYNNWSSLGTLKGSINGSRDEQGSHPDDLSVSVSSVSVLFCDTDSRLFASHCGSVECHPWCHDVTMNHAVYTSAWPNHPRILPWLLKWETRCGSKGNGGGSSIIRWSCIMHGQHFSPLFCYIRSHIFSLLLEIMTLNDVHRW